MRWSFRIARVSGIDVKLHLTFLLLPLLFGLQAYLSTHGSIGAAVETVTLLALIFGCVLLHEFGHAFAARHYGIRTVDITLLPIGGLARLERMPEEPAQEIVVALAGPLVNVIIILGLGLTLSWEDIRWAFDSRLDEAPAAYAPLILLVINAKLLLFNLIPAFPMDGGRVLRAVLAWVMGYARATRAAAGVGQIFAVLFVLAGLGMLPPWFASWNFVLVLIAFFIYTAGAQEANAAQIRHFARSVDLSQAMITDFRTLPADATLADAVALLVRTMQANFPVVDAGNRVQGILAHEDLIAGLGEGGGDATPVAQIMRRDVPAISARDSFEDALLALQASGSPLLPVNDPESGCLVGLITPDGVDELMTLHATTSKAGGATQRGDSLAGLKNPLR